MLEDVKVLIGPDDPAPCKEWLAYQFTFNNCRAIQNERYFGRINIVRKIQKYTIIKENIDSHYSNAVLKGVRKFGIEHINNTLFILLDNKNKMKFGAPGEPLA